VDAGEEIARAYEGRDFARAMRLIMTLADRANEYLDRTQPWKLRKQEDQKEELTRVCTVALNLYRQIAVYLSPVLPKLAEQSEALLGASMLWWTDAQAPLVGTELGAFSHLMQRVDTKKIEQMIKDSQDEAAADAAAAPEVSVSTNEDGPQALESDPLAPVCTIEDFDKVDLRIARVLDAEQVPEARKLLKLTVSLGGDDRRTVFAGIKSAYVPDDLKGRLVAIVANLAPRKMKFGLSEGMVICAGEGKGDLFVLSPDSGAKPGQRIH
jgi:methionyl-tRNA synthetase